MRRLLQVGFLALTLVAVFLVGGNAERWCPFGGVEALYTYVSEGNLPCSLGISNFYILIALLVMTLLLRRAFCSHLCPIGTISEHTRRGARRLGLRGGQVSPRWDRWLSLGKIAALGAILWVTWRSGELLFRGVDPCYALLSRHGEDITFWAYVSAGGILIGSLFTWLPFCRWLCPLAAVLDPFSRLGLGRVRRHEEHCIDCGACARACPMRIPVDRVEEVTAARCTTCLSCVDACPADRAALTWGGPLQRDAAPGSSSPQRRDAAPGSSSPQRRDAAPGSNSPQRRDGTWPRLALPAVILLLVAAAAAAAHLLPLPSFTYERGGPETSTAVVGFEVGDLTCRGRASLLVFFLDRDDAYALSGHLKLEAWPGPGAGRARITHALAAEDVQAIRLAITEPYYNLHDNRWYASPFTLEPE